MNSRLYLSFVLAVFLPLLAPVAGAASSNVVMTATSFGPAESAPRLDRALQLRQQMARRLSHLQAAQVRAARRDAAATVEAMRSDGASAVNQAVAQIHAVEIVAIDR